MMYYELNCILGRQAAWRSERIFNYFNAIPQHHHHHHQNRGTSCKHKSLVGIGCWLTVVPSQLVNHSHPWMWIDFQLVLSLKFRSSGLVCKSVQVMGVPSGAVKSVKRLASSNRVICVSTVVKPKARVLLVCHIFAHTTGQLGVKYETFFYLSFRGWCQTWLVATWDFSRSIELRFSVRRSACLNVGGVAACGSLEVVLFAVGDKELWRNDESWKGTAHAWRWFAFNCLVLQPQKHHG